MLRTIILKIIGARITELTLFFNFLFICLFSITFLYHFISFSFVCHVRVHISIEYYENNWDNIKSDLEDTLKKIININNDAKSTVNEMWNLFKNNLTKSINKNIPHKMLTYKHRLPWIHNKLRKMINKKNKLYFKMKKDKKYKEKYKQLKHQVQEEQRHAYNTYIEKLILDLLTNDPDQSFNNQSKPKKLFSFIKSLRTNNSGVAPLKKEGQLVADTKQKANTLNEQFKSVFTTESIDNLTFLTRV